MHQLGSESLTWQCAVPSSWPLPEAKAPTPTGSTLLDRRGKRLRKNFLVTGMVTQAGLSVLIARCYCLFMKFNSLPLANVHLPSKI